ncbi:MAG: methionyl-tRNA formyltransferase [Hoeflea sp.]|uniref:methionyl-tRNA formyltransferase n=1 Tax=Hoeflea sp. TaxID=1940281 RepID=UPI001DC38823|nr:methionyl-tRNA formyltransferase [Hoeflea sp.]MBU4531407.1 methionyl-tRNA formyltransferase [Alphaproteobacteria bacterium]MBU4544264.1 methionyl-tRNA formyltransferase [Alphaproteobacteria bacterium]MBU4550499.1 methionyl-tRNA formyltransferase [Alphaproteobacteria bacterium]MBV1724683.1 methionyl-tRNA formyltransferase [Hoeflea sp.]MBV1760703.1 methionyl-tRNA formyltransferase [Hoeflea sp.]
MSLRLIFMGTPDYAAPTLEALHKAGHEIVAVYSQPPRPSGRRGLEVLPSPVHRLADRLGIPVFTPKSLKSEEEQAAFRALNADAAVVVAYGLLLPKAILDAPRLGAWNGHASLLPRWRGAAPIQRAIMAGDTETGVMIMQMDEGLDTGPVALTEKLPLTDTVTAGELHDQLSALTARLMVEAMARLERGELPVSPQPKTGVTYAAKISKAETRVDFSRPAGEVRNHVRGLSPAPGAWFELAHNGRAERVKLLAAEVEDAPTAAAPGSTPGPTPGTVLDDCLLIACGERAVRLLTLQKAGGRPLPAADFLRGTPVTPGTVIA